MAILDQIQSFSPFGFDAAGFLTLLGSDEVNQSVGRFVRSRWLEYMPFLSPHVLASNIFLKKQAGYNVYNLTGGVHTTNLAAWFTRFLASHEKDIGSNLAVVKVDILDRPRRRRWDVMVAFSLAFILFGLLTVLCVLADDWFGFASTMGILFSVFVREIQIERCRAGLDESVREKIGQPDVVNKILIIDPDGMVTSVFMPGHLLLPVFMYNPSYTSGFWFSALRNLGWVAFFVHIIALNSATFLIKLITSVWLILSTLLYVWKFGCEDSSFDTDLNQFLGHKQRRLRRTVHIGSMLKLELTDWPANYEFAKRPGEESIVDPQLKNRTVTMSRWRRVDTTKSTDRQLQEKARRMDVYAWLNMTDAEERSMVKWDLFPHAREPGEDPQMAQWWEDYKSKKALIAADPWHIASTDHPAVVEER